MELAEVHSLIDRVAAVDVACADRGALCVLVGEVQRLMSWCESRQLLNARHLADVSSFPENDFAGAARTNLRGATRLFERSAVVDAMPAFGAALASGNITVEHVDTAGRALRSLEAPQRPQLITQAPRLALVASHGSLDEFARVVRDEVRRIETDDGVARLERQKRAARLRAWFDHNSGMWKLSGEFDPVTGLSLAGLLDNMIATMFAKAVPDGCPADPSAKQDYLRSLALVALMQRGRADAVSGARTGGGGVAGRAEVIVVVDTTDVDNAGRPRVDWGFPVEIPLRVLSELAGDADITTIVVRNGVVLHAPGQLDLGRSTRIANRAQRRALRALYPTCAIPGCTVRFEICKVHHVHWWRHGGRTDFCNLLPVCIGHHHKIHDADWAVTLRPDRSLTIHLPDGTLMTTGPPGPLKRRAA